MKPCPHRHIEARIWSRHFKDWRVVPTTMTAVNPDALVCRDCKAWLAMGESNDVPEAVRVEIAAAARSVNEPVPRSLGVRAHDDPEDACLACAVMFLARAIETHRDSPWSVESIATHEGES